MSRGTKHPDEGKGWKALVQGLTDQFVDHVLNERQVGDEMIPLVKCELKIYLGLLLGSKLNEEFSEKVALSIIKYYMLEVHAGARAMEIPYHKIISISSNRHDFFIDGLFDQENREDFLRRVAMQWFQFPLQEIDGEIRPHMYDFSVYFSDNLVASEILFKLAPCYSNAILDELKFAAPSFMLD